MFSAHSKFATFGWWLAWVYLLSLAGLLFLPWVALPPESPSIAFVERGITVTEQDGTVIEEVVATVRLSEPARHRLNVGVEYVDNTAKEGRDFAARPSGRLIVFEKGEQEKVIRFGRRGARDVEIQGPTQPAGGPVEKIEDRSFSAVIKDHPELQPVGDPGRLAVTLLRTESVTHEQPVATFAVEEVEADEKDLPGKLLTVNLDKPLAASGTATFTLCRAAGDRTEPIATLTRTIEAGAKSLGLRIADFPAAAIEEHRVLNDDHPEADETYTITMMSSDVYPAQDLLLTALNDDGADLKVRTVSREEGTEIAILDAGPTWEGAEPRFYELEVTLPNGEKRNLGSCRAYGPGIKIPADVMATCKGRRLACTAKPCRSAGGGGGGGAGSGAGGGGKGCCRGGGCPKGQGAGECDGGGCLVGPAIPGDYLLIVVNNERLHEPGDTILERVKEALADKSAKPYGNGAIIVNPKDEDTMTARGGEPKKDKMFQPFEQAGQNVVGQLERVKEVIARKREAAARPDLRAVVVWPERDLASGTGLDAVAGPDQQPVSFLMPGVDPSVARNMRALVPRDSKPGTVTVRSPKEDELTEHIINVMSEGGPVGDAGGGKPGDAPPPRDGEEALGRTTG